MEFWRGDKYITIDEREQRHVRRVWLRYFITTEEFDRELPGKWFRGEAGEVWIPYDYTASAQYAKIALEKAKRLLRGISIETSDRERCAIERMRHTDRKLELAALNTARDVEREQYARDTQGPARAMYLHQIDAMRCALEGGRISFPHGDIMPKWGRNPWDGPEPRCWLNYVECTMRVDPASPWQGPDQTCLLTKQAKAPAPAPRPPRPRFVAPMLSQAQVDFLSSAPISMHADFAEKERRSVFVRELPPGFKHEVDPPPVPTMEIKRLEIDRDAARRSRDVYCAQRDAARIEALELQRKLNASEAREKAGANLCKELIEERDTLHRKLDASEAQVTEQNRGRRVSDGEIVRLLGVLGQSEAREKDLAGKLAMVQERNLNQAKQILSLGEELARWRGRVLW